MTRALNIHEREGAMKHELVDDVLKRITGYGIEARCTCGWSSCHFTSLSASAAFREHQDQEAALAPHDGAAK